MSSENWDTDLNVSDQINRKKLKSKRNGKKKFKEKGEEITKTKKQNKTKRPLPPSKKRKKSVKWDDCIVKNGNRSLLYSCEIFNKRCKIVPYLILFLSRGQYFFFFRRKTKRSGHVGEAKQTQTWRKSARLWQRSRPPFCSRCDVKKVWELAAVPRCFFLSHKPTRFRFLSLPFFSFSYFT